MSMKYKTNLILKGDDFEFIYVIAEVENIAKNREYS